MNTLARPYARLSPAALAAPVEAPKPAHTPKGWQQLSAGRDHGATPGRQLYARVGQAGAERLAIQQAGGSEAEFAANLALVLAAADLLSALEDLLPHAVNAFGHQDMVSRRCAIDAARAAITKAGG